MAKDGGQLDLGVASELLEDAPCGIVATDADGRLLYVNATLLRWLGWTDPAEVAARKMADLMTVPGRLFYESHLIPMMRLQGFAREISCALAREEGPPLPVLLNGVARRNSSGTIVRFDYTIFDARERQMYEEELRRARREADQLAAIVRSSPNAILRVDGAGIVRTWNRGAERHFGHTAEAAVGKPVSQVIELEGPPGWFSEACKEAAQETTFEARHRSGIEFEGTIAPMLDRGQLPGSDFSVILRDVSARKQAERRLKVVVDEMRHRVKNTLGVVAGMARQSLPSDLSGPFVGRLNALAQAHDALFRTNWTQARLSDLMDFAMLEAGGPERLSYDVPPVDLSPQQTTALSMALHELVTNALKYGALSHPDGWVKVQATVSTSDAIRLRLVWHEQGGPPVVEPKQKGFGLNMIGFVLASDAGGNVAYEFRPEGFRCEIEFEVDGTASE